MMTARGPYLSTNHASIGTTNSVQPYCRFAIIAMQTMPIASCSQRKYAASGGTVDAGGCEFTDMIAPQGTLSVVEASVTRAAYWYVICQSASHSSGGGGRGVHLPRLQSRPCGEGCRLAKTRRPRKTGGLR